MIFKYGCHNHSRSVMLAGPRLAPLRMRGSLPMMLSGGGDMHVCVCVFMFVPRLCVACRLWLDMRVAWNYTTRILILHRAGATSVTYHRCYHSFAVLFGSAVSCTLVYAIHSP